MTTSQRPVAREFRRKFLRWLHQVYSRRAPRSRAINSARRFSKPSPRWLENGRLLGSAHTRRRRPSQAYAEQTSATSSLRKRERIEHSAFRGMFAQIGHGVGEPEGRRAVYGIDATRHHGPGPPADSREYRNVFLTVRPPVDDGLSDDSRPHFELPQQCAGARVQSFEPAVHRAVKNHVAGA